MLSVSEIRSAVARLLPEAQRLLCELIRFPSTPGCEQDAMAFLLRVFDGGGVSAEKAPLSDGLLNDPDYSDPVPGIRYDGRYNIRLMRAGTGGGKTLLFNAHTDVVPPSEGMADPWGGRVQDGAVYGRGACDDKGQIAVLFLVLRVLREMGVILKGDLIAHLVVEEENGGNGSLAMARRGERADACIVLEPSENRIQTSIRGAVWFRLIFSGKAGHSGQAGQTRSALLLARDAMGVLESYHAELLKKSRGFPLFDIYPNPMPLTFGHLEAGNWPAAAPSKAVLEGVLGFLPNRTKEQVCEEFRQVLMASVDPRSLDLHFMYRHDCSVLDPAHALPQGLLRAGARCGCPLEVGAMTASCDAWLYRNDLDIPTVVYGAGSLKVAHSKEEHIRMADIAATAEALLHFIGEHCGEAT